MVDQISQMALDTLRNLVIDEARFLSGVAIEVDEVEMELKTIHSFLKDADTRPDRYNSAVVSNLVADLNEVALKAELVLEKYAIQVASKKGGTLKKRVKRYTCILGECASIHGVGKDIEIIRSRIATLFTRVESVPKVESSSNDQHLLRPSTYGHQVEKYFVGMEKDIEHLVSLVKNHDTSSNPVISIYGMGGLGKTTLAQKVYQHVEINKCFEARAWVCVSQQFNAKIILQQILKQLILKDEKKEEINNMDERELVVELYNVQMGKKCLIVMDDIWKRDHWNLLKPAFPMDESNCKVLLTTRDKRIASEECTLYELNHLSEEQGWELLRKIAVPRDYLQDHKIGLAQYEVIGREIVQKCGRLPLAISVIGGILRHKQSLSEWESASSNIDSYLRHGEGVEEDRRVTQVLDLSYNSLPYYLKPCFLYLGCFPEDEEIDAQRLYLLWMAEGLVSSEDRGRNETLRDVARRYLSELASRCMVQTKVDEYPSMDFVYEQSRFHESCHLHDLMRDLCLRKGEEEMFVKVIDLFRDVFHIPSNDVIPRLAIHFDELVDDESNEKSKKESLRSLLVIGKSRNAESIIRSKNILTNLNKLKFLRSLILERCTLHNVKLPSELGKLIHLKYLSLFGSTVEELPTFVCDMLYLQTLDLRVSNAMTFPDVIYKMERLKHLFMNYKSRENHGIYKLRLDGLKELETLDGYNSKYDDDRDICKLTNLQYLSGSIWDDESLHAFVTHLRSNPSNLRETNLDIHNCFVYSAILKELLKCESLVSLLIFHGGVYCDFPSYEPGMCTNLVSLFLEEFEIVGDLMEILGKFPKLKFLDLRRRVFAKKEMICFANSFPQLKRLKLRMLLNVERWRMDEGAMPNLSCLVLESCWQLERLPDRLRYIATLQEFVSLRMPRNFNDRLRVVNGKEGEDYYKISHIPSISITDDW